MKIIILFFLTFFLLDNISARDTLNVIKQDQYTIEILHNDVKEIRRDQLNYRIEKDLLKETYSSNYTTIQIVISLILGIFTILGYLGLRSIFSQKKEYEFELFKLKDLKSEFEIKLKDLTVSQEKVEEQIKTIDRINDAQNKQIKILEIKEKVGTLYNQKNYHRTLDYVKIGLELSINDLELLIYRAYTLLRLRDYSNAIEAHKYAYGIDPSNSYLFTNLAELYLIEGHIEKYDELISEKGEQLKLENSILLTYFEIFKYFKQKRFIDMRKVISEYISKVDLTIIKNHVGDWDFIEVYDSIKYIENSIEKSLFINFTNYLKGNISGSQIKGILEASIPN